MRVLIAFLSSLALAWTPIPTFPSPDVPLAVPIGYYAGVPSQWYDGDTDREQYGSDIASDGQRFFAVSSDPYYPQGAMLLDEQGETTRTHSTMVSKESDATPAVAWSGRNYLVVWEEGRGSLVAARFTADGQRIDTKPIFLRQVTPSIRSDETEIDVAWDGTKYVVVTNSSEIAHIGEDGRLIANHIPTTGTYVASREGVTIVSRDVIAAGAPGFFVVYLKGQALYGRALDAHGNETGEEIFFAHSAKEPAVVWHGTHWVVAWVDAASHALYVIRQDVDHSPRLVGTDALRPALASNGTRVVIAWLQFRGADLATKKTILDAAGLQPDQPLQRWSYGSTPPAMTRIGTTTLVVWRDHTWDGDDFLRTQPVVSGVALPARERKIDRATLPGTIDIASNGVDALVVMPMSTPRELHLYRVAADGTVLREETIAGQNAVAVRVIWNGSHYIVMWDDKHAGQRGTYRAVRVNADGTLVDGTPRAIGSSEMHHLYNPNIGVDAAVASDGTTLVVWTTRTSKRGAGVFLSPDLEITELPPVPVDARILDADVASDGDAFLIVYYLGSRMVWVRASRDGVSPFTILQTPWPDPASLSASAPDLRTFWTGENYLVVRAVGDVHALRIAPDGTAIDPAMVQIANVPARMIFGARRPAIAYTENRALEFAYLGADDEVSGDRVIFRSLLQAKRRTSR